MNDLLNRHVEQAIRAKALRDEEIIRSLLQRWVSEIEPAVARDHNGEIIGLCPADSPVGSRPSILRAVA